MTLLTLDQAKRAIEKWGIQAQHFKTIEECGELVRSISRSYNGYAEHDNLIEELIDVRLMVEQLCYYYAHNSELYSIIQNERMAKFESMLREGEL